METTNTSQAGSNWVLTYNLDGSDPITVNLTSAKFNDDGSFDCTGEDQNGVNLNAKGRADNENGRLIMSLQLKDGATKATT
jgi:hypothetical protein